MIAATPLVIAELVSLGLGVPVGTEVSDSGSLPAVRVAKTGDLEAPNRWEAAPLFQVEAWAATEGGAEDLAHAIESQWWNYTAHVVSPPGGTAARVFGRWVEVAPYPLPNPDDTDFHRFVLSLGIRFTGVHE